MNCRCSRQRPSDTVTPLADDLGLTLDLSCDGDDSACVASVIEGFNGPGNVLVCWEHKALTDIITALGDSDAPKYPSNQ